MDDFITAAERRRFADFIDAWRDRGRKPKTLLSYASAHASMFATIAKARGHPADLASIGGIDLRNWKASCLAEDKEAATINHRLLFIRMYAAWAHRKRDISASHLEGITSVQLVPHTPTGALYLRKDELQRFFVILETKASLRDRALVALLLNGLRLGEAVGLKRSDITLNAHRGHIKIHGDHVKFSSARHVPLTPQARYHLGKFLQAANPDGVLFVGERGALTESGAYKAVVALAKLAGVKLHPHTLRHTFSKLWLDRQGDKNDLVGLQSLLGHSRIDTTAHHYARKSLADLSQEVEKLTL